MEENLIENGVDLVVVKLGFNVGDKFATFKEFQEKLDRASKENFVRLWRRDSRTIEGAKKKIKRFLKSELEFYQLRYACFYAQKHRPKPNLGKRKRRSLVKDIETACPASISLKVTENGDALEICNMVEYHNHLVNEQEYQKLLPKKKNSLELLMEEADGNVIVEDATTSDDKYKIVLKKCRHIARIASVSGTNKVQDIIKNLDDYIFYLKYTLSKDQIERVEDEPVNNNVISVTENENIKIIVESDTSAESNT